MLGGLGTPPTLTNGGVDIGDLLMEKKFPEPYLPSASLAEDRAMGLLKPLV
jgi:hypothetical protein